MSSGTNWRILIVEDNETIANQLVSAAPSFVHPPDAAAADLCATFKEAAERLKRDRYDIVILDLKDDGIEFDLDATGPAGLRVFEELRKTKFVPVIFYTAHTQWVRDRQTSFVRVVEKTQSIKKVGEEVRSVIATQLPALTRQVEEIQRSYLWDFVSKHWKDFEDPADQADIAYLMARRLAIALKTEAGNLASNFGGTSHGPTKTGKAHPMAMYIVPSIGPHPMAGDILLDTSEGRGVYWLILTPSCDFAQSKANHVTMVRCERLTDREEYKKRATEKGKEQLRQLIEDKRGDRFKFLPRAFFIPDLVVDFQQIRSLAIESLKDFQEIATLDSPFAESAVARFSRYFSRLGTPDVDPTIVLNRMQDSSQPPTGG